jgi:hypothetical protein
MASKVVANFVEACDRYAIHRRLKLESAQLYSGLTKKEKKFLHDWISAEIHSCPGRWCNILGDSLLDKLSTAWAPIFLKAPKLERKMILYRVVKGDHAAKLASLKIGATMELDRHSSFSHSPEMAKRYAAWLAEEDHVLVLCVEVRKSTPFVFISGWDWKGGLSTNPQAQNVEDIDNTQGEIVLAPMTLKKTDKNVRTTICDGFFSGAANTTRKIVIASFASATIST